MARKDMALRLSSVIGSDTATSTVMPRRWSGQKLRERIDELIKYVDCRWPIPPRSAYGADGTWRAPLQR